MLQSLMRSSLLLSICGLMLLAVPSEAAAQNVLVLENGDVTTFHGDQIAAKTTGFTITSEGPTAFAARSDFSSFDVVFFACVFNKAPRDAAKNNAAFQAVAPGGRVVITGLHAEDHDQPGAGQFLQDAITWIADCQNTGVLALCDFPVMTWDYLPFPGVTASSPGINPHDCDVTFIPPTHPIFANTTDGPGAFTLDDWNESVHAVLNTLGPGNGGYEDDGFLAVAESGGPVLRVCALAGDFCDGATCSQACGNNGNKVLLCHVPPGNTGNAQTLCISPNAAAFHLENHEDDHCGSCDDDGLSLVGSRAAAVCPSDINGDGTTNVLDLVELLLQFGATCP